MARKDKVVGRLLMKVNTVSVVGMILCLAGVALFILVSMVVGLILLGVGALLVIIGVIQSFCASKKES